MFFVSGCQRLLKLLDRHSEVMKQIKEEVLKTRDQGETTLDGKVIPRPESEREKLIAGAIASHIFTACNTITDAVRNIDPEFNISVREKLRYYSKQYKRNIRNAYKLRVKRQEQKTRNATEIAEELSETGEDENDWLKEYHRYAETGELTEKKPISDKKPTSDPNIVIDPKTGRKVQHKRTNTNREKRHTIQYKNGR